jgi:hypothetical protein
VAAVEAGDQGVTGRVGSGEVGVGGERLPRLADEAEAAQRLGRDAEQDLVDRVRGQLDVAGEGGGQEQEQEYHCGWLVASQRRSHRRPAGLPVGKSLAGAGGQCTGRRRTDGRRRMGGGVKFKGLSVKVQG